MGLVVIECFVLHIVQYLSVPFILLAPKLFHLINTSIAGWLWGSWVWLVEDWHKTPITITGDKIKPGENALVISNHQSWSDIVMISKVATKAKMINHQKWMAKNVLRFVPFIGWGLHFIDTIFLKRDWNKDQIKIEQTFSHIVDKNVPFWLIIFPEGTRLTASKLQSSQKLMQSKGEPHWQRVMRPRSKGFVAAIAGLRSKLDAIYSLTIDYGEQAVSPWELFAGQAQAIKIDVKRYDASYIAKLVNQEQIKTFF
jgi:lysophosphatidic acid acyltransferase / lysophosphatidylinositol acyltransferase